MLRPLIIWKLSHKHAHGGGHGNQLQYSCLENPMRSVAWKATVHGVTKGWTLLKRLSMHAHSSDVNENLEE